MHAAKTLNIDLECTWFSDDRVSTIHLKDYNGFFIAPGSPLEAHNTILKAIQFARENAIPCLGTCGGFQRIITEFCRNVLHMDTITHAEKDPEASNPLFSKLSCHIAETKGVVTLQRESQIAQWYDSLSTTEAYYCSYGLNQKFTTQLKEHGLQVSGWDEDNQARIVELMNHPFFVGTLFVPQVLSADMLPHPLIKAFIKSLK